MKFNKYLLWGLVAALALTAFAPLAIPTRPALRTPINRLVVTDPNAVTLKWAASVPTRTFAIVSYDIEVADSSALDPDLSFVDANIVDSATVAAPVTEYVIAGGSLSYGTTYYWHARANDTAPSTSTWSVTGIFRVAVEPPTLDEPVSVGTLTLKPTFSWTPGAQNATNYTIQFSTDSGFSSYTSFTVTSTSNPVEYTPVNDMLPDTSFYWRVRANNATLGTSSWAVSVAPFRTANPPTVPVLVSPNNTREPPTPLLTWRAVSLRGNTTFNTYEVQIFDTNQNLDTAIPVFSADVVVDPSLGLQPTTSYKVPDTAGLLPTTTYYWRINAYSDNLTTGIAGEYSTSKLYTFYTSIVGKIDSTTMDPSETLGNVPGLLGPFVPTAKTIDGFTGAVLENANLLGLNPVFRWDPGALNAETFTLQVATQASGSCDPAVPNDSTFAKTIVNVSLSYSLSKYTVNLQAYPNHILCWRIRGNHSLYGSSDWSDVQIFRTANPPGVPEPVNPRNGTLTNDNSPRLVWKKVGIPSGTTFAKYEIEISYNSTFSGYSYPPDTVPPFVDPVNPVSYPLPSPIMPGNSVQDPIYPVVPPKPAFPHFPAIIQAHDPITELANAYECPYDSYYSCHQIEEDDDFISPEGFPFYGAKTYYWRVRSYNEDGEFSSWSAPFYVRITPDRPVNLTLTDCAGVPVIDPISARPCFDWDDVSGAGKYNIQVAKDDQFRYVVHTGTSTVSEYQATRDLPSGLTLYWRVTASAGTFYGTSLLSATASFMSATPPSTPVLLTPKLNQLSLSTEPTLTWKTSTVPLGINFDHYEIEIAQDKVFSFIVDAASTAPGDPYDTTYTVGPGILTPARTYFWRVRACNDVLPVNQCSNWSLLRYFRVAVAAPILIIPPDTTTMRPIFEWNPVNDAIKYNIWVSRNASCLGPLVAGGTTVAPIYQPRVDMLPGTYYWCVRAQNILYGPGAWSLIDSFILP